MALPALEDIERRLATISDPVAFLAGIFEHTPVAYQVFDHEGRCVLTNGAYRALMGVEPPPGYRLLHRPGGPTGGMPGLLRAALAGETVASPAFWFDPREIRPDPSPGARPVAVSCTVFPLRGPDGGPTHAVFAFLDHTAERLYQKRLAKRGETLRAIARRERETRRDLEEETRRLDRIRLHLEASQRIARIGSWELDLARRDDLSANPLRWSDECHRVFGFEPGEVEVTNALFFSRVHPDDRDAVRAAVSLALETGADYSCEHRIVLPSGEERIVRERARIVRDPATGAPQTLVGTSQDVTAERRLGEELAEARRLDAVGRIAGGVAHEFNNLLTAILGFTSLAAEPGADPAARARHLEQVRIAAERGAEVTRRLLTFARRDAARPEILDAGALVQRTVPTAPGAPGDPVRVVLRLAGEPCPVRIDRGHLEEVLGSLVQNAREAMPAGGTITVSAEVHRGSAAGGGAAPCLVLTVADTGPGMPPAVLARAFEPFFTTKGPTHGAGLGLALCRAIVERHGGSISLRSAAGAGTTVEVRLPLAAAPPPAAAPTPVPAGRAAPCDAVPARVPVVLVVEDHPQVRSAAEASLRDAGFEVLTAVDGAEGLATALAAPVLDLVVTDMVMPGLVGRELAVRLRRERPDVPVILCSGHADDPDLERDLEALAVPFLPKPYLPSALIAAARRAMESRTR